MGCGKHPTSRLQAGTGSGHQLAAACALHCPTMDVAGGAAARQGHGGISHGWYLSHALLTSCSWLSSGHRGIIASQCVPGVNCTDCPDAFGHQFEELQGVVSCGAGFPQPLELQGEDLAPGTLRTLLVFLQLPAPVGARHHDPPKQEITCPGSQLASLGDSQTA